MKSMKKYDLQDMGRIKDDLPFYEVVMEKRDDKYFGWKQITRAVSMYTDRIPPCVIWLLVVLSFR